MQKIKFLKNGGRYVSIKPAGGEPIIFGGGGVFGRLVLFLTEGLFSDFCLKILNDPKENGLIGDSVYLRKVGCNDIAVGCTQIDEDPDPNEFYIPKDELIRVSQEWKELCRNPNINKITLTYDKNAGRDQKISLKGQFVCELNDKLIEAGIKKESIEKTGKDDERRDLDDDKVSVDCHRILSPKISEYGEFSGFHSDPNNFIEKLGVWDNFPLEIVRRGVAPLGVYKLGMRIAGSDLEFKYSTMFSSSMTHDEVCEWILKVFRECVEENIIPKNSKIGSRFFVKRKVHDKLAMRLIFDYTGIGKWMIKTAYIVFPELVS